MPDSWKRTITKGLTWFAIRFTTLFIVTFYITGDSSLAGALSTVFYSVGAILYIVHERVWNNLDYGRTNTIIS